jgi:uncharacterized coiled-coil protein SlyX
MLTFILGFILGFMTMLARHDMVMRKTNKQLAEIVKGLQSMLPNNVIGATQETP